MDKRGGIKPNKQITTPYKKKALWDIGEGFSLLPKQAADF
jgi:hypothetical protein